jgi:beta-lactamase superfamily II metal-dependent hydrolase
MKPSPQWLLALTAAALVLCLAVGAPMSAQVVTGRPLPPWQEGMLDIHQINTGKGDAALFIFPDGTTLLLDAGDLYRDRPAGYDAPPRPDGSRRAGEWIARYIQAVHPKQREAVLDYAAITHFHGDHMGTVTDRSPLSASGAYHQAGLTEVAEHVPIRRMLDRGWPDYDDPAPAPGRLIDNYRAFLRWQSANRSMRVERFEPGRNDQVVLINAPERYPTFAFQNIAANGRVWTGSGTEARSRFPESEPPGENPSSLAFRLTYGRFAYFNGGDMPGAVSPDGPEWRDMESAVAWAVGPVDVHALNHHGFQDSANAFFLSVLQPRVHILAVYASSHPGPDVMRRMRSTQLYPGPRDIFLTNGLWEGRRRSMVELFGQEETAWLEARIREVPAQGHVVVRVAPGGDTYHVMVLEDGDESRTVRSVHGPYDSR